MTDYDHNAPASCGHKYCPVERCGYMPDLSAFRDKYTVSGNRMTITRLDAEGNPTGDPISLSSVGRIEMDVNPETDDVVLHGWTGESITLDLSMRDVDIKTLALLTGQSPQPYEVWGSARLYRWLPRFLKHRLKRRWMRRAYGG